MHCLDSWAVLAWLDGEEPAAEIVQGVIDSGRPAMSWMNLVEVTTGLPATTDGPSPIGFWRNCGRKYKRTSQGSRR